MREIRKYFIISSWSCFQVLVSVTGGMVKTNMSTLMLKLEIGIMLVEAILKPFSSVIGKMALVASQTTLV